MTTTGQLDAETQLLLRQVGFQRDAERAGTCVLVDQSVRYTSVRDDQIAIMPLREALKRYEWVQDLMFGLIDPQENEHVRQAAEQADDPVGHFVHVRAGAKVQLPVQTFSVIATPQARQFVHNVTLIDEGAEVDMIAGSAVPSKVHSGHHISIDETYVRAGATCRSLAVDQWGSGMSVHSYARTELGEGAQCSSTGILLTPIKNHVAQSRTVLHADARSHDQSIIFAPPGTEHQIDSTTYLRGEGAHAESVTRVVTTGGHVHSRALLVGEADGTQGFLGCDGLKITDAGSVYSTPGLLAKAQGAQLSHEASVGMISADKMNYLMALGMDEDRARELIVQGFLHLNERHLPAHIRTSVERMIAAARAGSM